MTQFEISETWPEDVEGLRDVLNTIDLFPAEMLGELLDPHLAGAQDVVWLSARVEGTVAGLCYAVPEALTNGTWNMLALGVHTRHQGFGCGRALVSALEHALRQRDARLLIVDTSSGPAQAPARAFYARIGYAEVARIADFWDVGDDKVTYRMAL